MQRHTTCQSQTDFKHVIVFVSQLTVAEGQVVSYGAFLYQNNCLCESLRHRAFAVGELFRGYINLCTNTKPESRHFPLGAVTGGSTI